MGICASVVGLGAAPKENNVLLIYLWKELEKEVEMKLCFARKSGFVMYGGAGGVGQGRMATEF